MINNSNNQFTFGTKTDKSPPLLFEDGGEDQFTFTETEIYSPTADEISNDIKFKTPKTNKSYEDGYKEWKEKFQVEIEKEVKDKYSIDGEIPTDSYPSYMAELDKRKSEELSIDAYTSKKLSSITAPSFVNPLGFEQLYPYPYGSGAISNTIFDTPLGVLVDEFFGLFTPDDYSDKPHPQIYNNPYYVEVGDVNTDGYIVDNYENLQRYAKENNQSINEAINEIQLKAFVDGTYKANQEWQYESKRYEGTGVQEPWFLQKNNAILNLTSQELYGDGRKIKVEADDFYSVKQIQEGIEEATSLLGLDIDKKEVYEVDEEDKKVMDAFIKFREAQVTGEPQAKVVQLFNEYEEIWDQSSWAKDGGSKLLDYNTGKSVLEKDASDEVKNWNALMDEAASVVAKNNDIDQVANMRNSAYYKLMESIGELRNTEGALDFIIGKNIGLQEFASEVIEGAFNSSEILTNRTLATDDLIEKGIFKNLTKLPGKSYEIDQYNKAYDEFVVTDRAYKFNIDPLTVSDNAGIVRAAEGFTKAILGEQSGGFEDMYKGNVQAYSDAASQYGGFLSKKGVERRAEYFATNDDGTIVPLNDNYESVGHMGGFLVNFYLFKQPFKAVGALNKMGKIKSVDKFRQATLAGKIGNTRIGSTKWGSWGTNMVFSGINEGLLMGGHEMIADYQVKGQEGMGPVEGFIIGSTGFAASSMVKWLSGFSSAAMTEYGATNLSRTKRFINASEEVIKKSTYPAMKIPIVRDISEKAATSILQSEGFMIAEAYDRWSQGEDFGDAVSTAFLGDENMTVWEKQWAGLVPMLAMNFFSIPAFKGYHRNVKATVAMYKAPKQLRADLEYLGLTEADLTGDNSVNQKQFNKISKNKYKEITNGESDLSPKQKAELQKLNDALSNVKSHQAYLFTRDALLQYDKQIMSDQTKDREMFYYVNRIANAASEGGFNINYEEAQFLDRLGSTDLSYFAQSLASKGVGNESIGLIKQQMEIGADVMKALREKMPDELWNNKNQRKVAFDLFKESIEANRELQLLESQAKRDGLKTTPEIESLKSEIEQLDTRLLLYTSQTLESVRSFEKLNKTGKLKVTTLSNEEYLKRFPDEKGVSAKIEGDQVFVNADFASTIKRFSTLTHEVLHPILGKQFDDLTIEQIQKDLNLTEEEAAGYQATHRNEVTRLFNEFMNSLTPEQRKAVDLRLDKSYRKVEAGDISIEKEDLVLNEDGSIKIDKDGFAELKPYKYASEAMTALKDAIVDKEVTFDEKSRKKVGGVITKALNKYFPNADFSTGEEVYEFILDFASDTMKGKTNRRARKLLEAATIAKTSDTKLSTDADFATRLNSAGKRIYEMSKEFPELYTDKDLVRIINSPSSSSLEKGGAVNFLVEKHWGSISNKLKANKALINPENGNRYKDAVVDMVLGSFESTLGRRKPLFENYDPAAAEVVTRMTDIIGRRTPEIIEYVKQLDPTREGETVEGRESMQVADDAPVGTLLENAVENISRTDIMNSAPVKNKIEAIDDVVTVSPKEVKQLQTDPLAFRTVSEKYSGKIGEIIFNVPSKKITEKNENLTYEDVYTHDKDWNWVNKNGTINEKKSAKKGDRITSEQFKHDPDLKTTTIKRSETTLIQDVFRNDNVVRDLMKTAPDLNVVSETVTVGEKNEPIHIVDVQRNVKGVSLNIPGNILKLMYKPVFKADGKRLRSSGVKSQVPVSEKRTELNNPSKEEIIKFQQSLGIDKNIAQGRERAKKLTKAQLLTIRQNLKGAAALMSDIVAQRAVELKAGGTPAERANYKVKKSKQSFSADKDKANIFENHKLEFGQGYGNMAKNMAKEYDVVRIKSLDAKGLVVDKDTQRKNIYFLGDIVPNYLNSTKVFGGGTLTNNNGKKMYLGPAERVALVKHINKNLVRTPYTKFLDKLASSPGLDPMKKTADKMMQKLWRSNVKDSKKALDGLPEKIYNLLKENPDYIDGVIALFDKASASNQHWWRQAAKVIGKQSNWNTHGAENLLAMSVGVGEHVLPQNQAAEFLIQSAMYALSKPKQAESILKMSGELLRDNYFQILMSVRNDNLVAQAGHKDSMPEGFWDSWTEAIRTGDKAKAWSIWSRYFSKELNKIGNEINPNELELFDVATDKVSNLADMLGIGRKVYGNEVDNPNFIAAQQEVIGEWSRRNSEFATIEQRQAILNEKFKLAPDQQKATEATANEISNRLFSIDKDKANVKMVEYSGMFDKALDYGRKLNPEVKKIRVFDFDDTIARSKSLVFYNRANESGKPTPKNKAIFMIGGPGSGKTNIGKGLELGRDGFKVVNQDIFIEQAKKEAGLPEIEKEYTKEQKSQRAKIGAAGQKAAKEKLEKYTKAGDGMVIDGTGASYNATMKKVRALEEQGYEVFMVHAKTSSEVALERNRKRKERSLPDFIVERTQNSVNENIEKYKKDLGKNFMEIDTETIKYGEPLPKEFVADVKSKLYASERGRLNAEEFAKEGARLVDEGFVMDFSDFNIVREGEKGPLFEVAEKIKKARGNEDLYILTARAPESREAIYEFLKSEGLEFKKENIVGLGNSTAKAKADWVVGKASEGFNDFYFADDAIKNVDAVKEALSQLDVKSKVQQARVKYSADLDRDFNEILQEASGIESFKEFSAAKAKVIGAEKGKYKFFIPYSAEDFLGLIYPTLGKGRLGEQQMAWYRNNLIRPYTRAMESLSRDRLQMFQDFKALKKQLDVPKDLRKKNKSGFTNEQAVRVYLWSVEGKDIPGLSKSDAKELIDIVNSDPKLKTFADQILSITKGDGYSKPGQNWLVGSITSDLIDIVNTTKRSKYLDEWQTRADVIFSKKNLNKLEAIYGSKYREALENTLARMKSGRNRIETGNRLSNRMLDYINASNGAIMFFNTRSAVLQTISAINFVNWSFNNPYQAGKAFANQKQYWKDFKTLMNSDYLVDRRNGLKLNIAESEIADAAATSKNKVKGALKYILQKGYLPTQYADSFAIASGGATWYRNRIIDLVKKGIPEAKAEKMAMEEWREIAERSQQSSDPSKISQQQASDAGRLILMFANTPMQYARLQKRALQDLINGRGDAKENISKIAYYGFVQNIIFNALQQAIFAVAMGDDDEKKDKTYFRTANGMLDTLLRGTGMAGQAVSVGKNFLLDVYERSGRNRPEYVDAIWKLTQISPPISSKISKLRQAAWHFDSKKRRKEIFEKGFSLDNPAYMAAAKTLSATVNAPLDRVLQKYYNIESALSEDADWWQTLAMLGGWPNWQIMDDKDKKKKPSSRTKTSSMGIKTKTKTKSKPKPKQKKDTQFTF